MKKIICIIIIFLTFENIKAQDGQLSYAYASPLSVNPALTGDIPDSKWRVMTTFRKQWSSFIDKGIVNYSLSFDAPFRSANVALGTLFYNNSSSDGAVRNISAVVSFAYNFYINYSSKTKFAFGLQAGFGQKSFDPAKLTFDNQYVVGVGFDSTLSSKEHFLHTNVMYPDFNFGMLLSKEMSGHNGNFFPWISLSAYHLTEPNESFYESVNSKLPRKYILNIGSTFKTSEAFSFVPHILAVMQSNVLQFNVGSTCNVNFGISTKLMFGAYVRNKDAVVAMLGIEYNKCTLQVVYDINTSLLKPVTRGFGGYEFTFKYMMANNKKYRSGLPKLHL